MIGAAMRSMTRKLPLTSRSTGRKTGRKTSRGQTKGSRAPAKSNRQKAKFAVGGEINLTRLRELLLTDLHVTGDEPLTSDMSPTMVERISLARSFLKKFEKTTNKDASKIAIQNFLQRNSDCGRWEHHADSELDAYIDGILADVIYRAFYPSFDSSFGLWEISQGFGVGSGSNLECEEDDFLTKVFHSPLARTNEDLYVYYTHAIRGSTWHEAEKLRAQRYGHKIVVGSRLTTVPKTVEEMRIVSPEPPLNMLFQKGIEHCLRRILRDSYGIDLSKQPEINRWLARRGSVDESPQGFCTIDLKGASDNVSIRFCERFIPRVPLSWLMLTRSPYTVLPDGSTVKMDMMATMGNAFCFPLQTLIFASITKACYIAMGIKTSRCDGVQPTYGVFGDDIIVRREAYNLVIRTLRRYGFTPNDQKSFCSGPFRESCGGDFWGGYPVRGVYLKKLDTHADVYSIINRLVRWSLRSGWSLELTLSYLVSKIRKPFLVPFTEGDTCGIKVPFSLYKSHFYDLDTRSPIYWALVTRGFSYGVPESEGEWQVSNGSPRNYNGSAILLATVGGYCRDGRVGFRSKSSPGFQVRKHVAPNWDYVPPAEAEMLRGANWKVRAAEILTGLV